MVCFVCTNAKVKCICCCSDVGFDDGDILLEDSSEDNIVAVQEAQRRMCVAHFTLQKRCDQQSPPCRQARPAQAEPEAEAAADSDLDSAPVIVRGRRGRRSAGIGRPDAGGIEGFATPGRKRPRASAETAGEADEESLLSPDNSKKIKGRVSASGMVVSVKDGRVLSRHLELKQMFATGYRNPINTNT